MVGASGRDMSTWPRVVAVIMASWLGAAGAAVAVEFGELDTDRDAFTPATMTAKEGTILTEASYVWIDNRDAPATNSFPELLVRLGTRPWFEWRLGVNYEQGSGGSVVSAVEVGEEPLGETSGSEANILYGCKMRLTDDDDWVPRSIVMVEGFTPVAGDVWGTEPVVTYAFGWKFAEDWRFDTAIRYAYADSEEGRFDRWMPSVVLRIPVTQRWEVHGEWFGSWSQGLADDSVRPFVGPGTHLMLTSSMEIGCRMGWGLTRDSAGYYFDTGMGWRF